MDMATKTAVKAAASPKASAAAPKPAKGVSDARFKKARGASIMLKHASDATRLQVILILADGEHHVGALCEQLSQSQPAVSHHLRVLAPRRRHRPPSARQE